MLRSYAYEIPVELKLRKHFFGMKNLASVLTIATRCRNLTPMRQSRIPRSFEKIQQLGFVNFSLILILRKELFNFHFSQKGWG